MVKLSWGNGKMESQTDTVFLSIKREIDTKVSSKMDLNMEKEFKNL